MTTVQFKKSLTGVSVFGIIMDKFDHQDKSSSNVIFEIDKCIKKASIKLFSFLV